MQLAVNSKSRAAAVVVQQAEQAAGARELGHPSGWLLFFRLCVLSAASSFSASPRSLFRPADLQTREPAS